VASIINDRNNTSLSKYGKVTKHSSYGQLIIGYDGCVISANNDLRDMLQSYNKPILGMHFGNAFSCFATKDNTIDCGQNELCQKCKINRLINQGYLNNSTTFRYQYKHQNNYFCKWFDLSVKPIIFKKDKALILTLHDVTKYIIENIKLKNKLEIDLATGALNKFSLMTKVDNLIRLNHEKSFTACMMDFDDFKIINDTYGHLTGDSVLEVFSTISKKHIRRFDFFGRYGGEEFVFVFINLKPSQAVETLRQIYVEFNSYLTKDISKPLTLSCGLSYIEKATSEFKNGTELIGHIDKLLYKAKQTGKNKMVTETDEYYF